MTPTLRAALDAWRALDENQRAEFIDCAQMADVNSEIIDAALALLRAAGEPARLPPVDTIQRRSVEAARDLRDRLRYETKKHTKECTCSACALIDETAWLDHGKP